MHRPHPVGIAGASINWGSSVIHFYYLPVEQARFVGFLSEGVEAGQAAILACPLECYPVLYEQLQQSGKSLGNAGVVPIEITANLRNSIDAVAAAARQAGGNGKPVRLLVDFGNIVPQEMIFEAEASLSSSLEGLTTICVSQYDGRAFSAPVTLEQFRTHALAIVGNALYHENRSYTRPETYFRHRAAAGSRR